MRPSPCAATSSGKSPTCTGHTFSPSGPARSGSRRSKGKTVRKEQGQAGIIAAAGIVDLETKEKNMMPVKIGFSSHCFPKDMEMEKILDFCKEYKFNAMELNTNTKNFDLQKVDESLLERIKRMTDSGKVRFTLHPSEGVNFSDSLEKNGRNSIEKVEEAIRLASRLGIQTVAVHPGSLNGDGTPETFEEALSQTISGIRRCALTAKQLGVRVSVENLCHVKGTVAPDIFSFFKMCEEIGFPLIGITLDTGHAALVDGLKQTLSVIGRYVDHIHIDDSSGQKSDHLELGKGKIDFYAMGDYLKTYDGIINIELKIYGKDYIGPILRSREYLLKLLAVS
jgi:sugar phosphate isomerase/epimerase